MSVRVESREKPLNAAAIEEALWLVIARQHVLRTRIFADGERLFQAVCPTPRLRIDTIDATGRDPVSQDALVDELMQADRAHPFDPRGAEGEVFRTKLVTLDTRSIECVFACHHGFWGRLGRASLADERLSRVRGLLVSGDRSEADGRVIDSVRLGQCGHQGVRRVEESPALARREG